MGRKPFTGIGVVTFLNKAQYITCQAFQVNYTEKIFLDSSLQFMLINRS